MNAIIGTLSLTSVRSVAAARMVIHMLTAGAGCPTLSRQKPSPHAKERWGICHVYFESMPTDEP